jgi:hypothetical protein
MKAFMILGAIVGFLIGTGCGLAGSSPWSATLWRGGIAALIAAILTRWWSRIWLNNLRDALHDRRNIHPSPSPDAKPGISI